MKKKRTYIAPTSEILVMAAEDVLTSSDVEENNPTWDEKPDEKPNKHENKWPNGKPGNGFGDKNHQHIGPPGQINKP